MLGYFFPSWYSTENPFYSLLYWVFMYSTLLCFSLPYLLICFKLKPINALLISLASYTIHHINNMVSGNINDFIGFFTEISGVSLQVVNQVVWFSCLCFVYAIFFWYYFRQSKENLELIYNSYQLTLFAAFVVLFTIVMSSCVRIYYYSLDINAVYIVASWSNLASCLLVIVLFFVFLRHNRLAQQLEMEKRLFNENKHQYELSKENIESLNIKFHDLKYRVQMLTDNNEHINKEDLRDIYDGLNIYDSVAKTGNKPLDVVLTEYALRCENNHISFTSVADGKALDFMSPSDIYSLFGNAITNAIEASTKVSDPDQRNISFVMKRKGNILFIELENYFNPKDMKRIEGRLLTSKKDKTSHGFGMQSMKNIVNKYDGSLTYAVRDNIFLLTITFTL